MKTIFIVFSQKNTDFQGLKFRSVHNNNHHYNVHLIYHALINALSAHMIHINLNMIFYTHEHSPTQISFSHRMTALYKLQTMKTFFVVFCQKITFTITSDPVCECDHRLKINACCNCIF